MFNFIPVYWGCFMLIPNIVDLMWSDMVGVNKDIRK